MSEFQNPASHIQELLKHDHFDELKEYIKNADLSMEPYLIDSFPDLLNKLVHVRTEIRSKDIGELIIKKMNPFARKF